MTNRFKQTESWGDRLEFAFVQCVRFTERYDPWLALVWCCEEFGSATGERWAFQDGLFFFRDPDDAFAFKLRWC
ncbi:MAG: hypothetical protein EOO77_29630 [Oxalobacteraceae bacterium]|nr:MAG: hypothetical protein EOO77_29630 [Oxalobacteraceae bacterium]